MTDGIDLAVRADRLAKSYGSVKALRGASFSLGPGVTALLGPNGAGKTTLLRILATTLRPSGGAFSVFGVEPSSAPALRWIRRRLGYMPEQAAIETRMTVRAVLQYIALLKELTGQSRRTEVERVLELVDLRSVARRRIRALSGGMRRRLLLAQALLADPPLLLLDEPAAGLDPEQRLRFRGLISELAPSRVVLLSTHQTDDLASLCDRVLVVHYGRLLFDGSPEGLIAFAGGRVWIDAKRGDDVLHAWRAPDGSYRHLGGTPPTGAQFAEPTIEEGYLALLEDQSAERANESPSGLPEGSPDD